MPSTKSIKKFFGWSKKSQSIDSPSSSPPGLSLHNGYGSRKSSRTADKMLKEYTENYNKVIKILLLGSGETGKTTIIKQMRILHVQGFSDEERLDCRAIIKDNVFECITALVNQMATLQIPLGDKGNLASWTFIRNMSITKNKEFSQEYFNHVKRLWADTGVQQCFSRAAEFLLPDCAKFFLDRVTEIGDPSFFPNDQFLLHSRRTTIGIQKIEFEVPIPRKFGGGGPQKFWMFDVGGQKGERRKWIQVFDGIGTVLFMVACNTFDQLMLADSFDNSLPINRLKESLDLFQDVWVSRFLRYAGYIVFLNKQDLLKTKVESGKDIGAYFPQYYTYSVDPGDGDNKNPYIRTRCFIRDLFHLATDVTPPQTPKRSNSSVNFREEDLKKKAPPRDLYFHFTTATDTNNIQRVFEDVHSMILNKNLREIGFA